MAGPYRNNVVQNTAGATAIFDPPLDAIYVTTVSTATSTFTVNGVATTLAIGQPPLGLAEIGGISRISGGAGMKYIGLRVLNKSGSSNATNDNLDTGD
jgi:hypothetical protein